MEYTTKYPSPVGTLLLASDGQALTGLWIENQKYYGPPCPRTIRRRTTCLSLTR